MLSYSIRKLRKILLKLQFKMGYCKRGKINYSRIYASFDIETTSTYVNDEKVAFMYLFAFSFNHHVVRGRTWNDFLQVYDLLNDIFCNEKIIVYVHNFAFEFQFIRRYIHVDDVFFIDERTPVSMDSGNVIFKCSYLLTGKTLDECSKTTPFNKLKGNLNYSLIRHSTTLLDKKEIKYMNNDVLILNSLIRDYAMDFKEIAYIPLTKTGIVREDIRNNTVRKDYFGDYKHQVQKMSLTPELFTLLYDCLQGGFCHANYNYIGEVLHNIHSFDFGSSHPFRACVDKFPSTPWQHIGNLTKEKFKMYLDKGYNCIFYLRAINVNLVACWEAPLSFSKCVKCTSPILDNGRIISAKEIVIAMTEIDYNIFTEYYICDSVSITSLYVSIPDYLPKELILKILDYFSRKTLLKGVAGAERDYQRAKENVNAIFGMAATCPVRDNLCYDDETGTFYKDVVDVPETLIKYNLNKNRFIWYSVGIYIPAFTRKALFEWISYFKMRYVYSDTDSVKARDVTDRDFKNVNEYNQLQLKRFNDMLQHYNITSYTADFLTNDGRTKHIGLFEYEGCYKTFKTLGAKRYIVEHDDGKYEITIAGLGKKAGGEYIFSQKDPFSFFSNGMEIPPDNTGKLTHTYIDTPVKGFIADYQGVIGSYEQRTSVHLEKTGFKLSLMDDFIDFLKGVKLKNGMC